MQDGEEQGDAKELTGAAVTLTDILDYQDDAVVSRTVIDK